MGKMVIRGEPVHESATDRQQGIRWWDQSVLQRARILVVGAGAIGNETIKNLALLGCGYVMVCDMDTIERSNLSRTVLFTSDDLERKKAPVAAARYLEMNVDKSHARADVFDGNIIDRLGIGVFRRVDVVLGCLDNIKTRMLVNFYCNLTGKPYIDGGIEELRWSVKSYHYPETACYACHMAAEEQIAAMTLDRSGSCSNVKRKMQQEGKVATVQVCSAMVSALQVQECIKILHKVRKGVLQDRYRDYVPQTGMEYTFDGMTCELYTIRHTVNEQCLFHHRMEPVTESPLNARSTVRETLAYARALNGGKPVRLSLDTDHAYIESATCMQCGVPLRIMRPYADVYEHQLFCENCAETQDAHGLPTLVSHHAMREDTTPEPILNLTLHDIGTPYLQVLTFEDLETNRLLYVETTGDLPAVMPNYPTQGV